MATQLDRVSALFENLQQFTRQLDSGARRKVIHRLRTTTRRVEMLLSPTGVRHGHKEQRLLKQLRRIRKRAGKVRDIDVQLSALANLNVDSAVRDRARVVRSLKDARAKRVKKLRRTLRAELEDGLRKRLKSTAARLPDILAVYNGGKSESSSRVVSSAQRRFAAVARKYPVLTERNLHSFRMDCKRIRYLAELAGGSPEAEMIVKEMERIQDAAGDWHDWITLTNTAEDLVPAQSPLLGAMRAATRSKYQEALQVAAHARNTVLRMGVATRKSGKPVGASGTQGTLQAAIA